MTDHPRVAIVGCGLIGKRRAESLGSSPLVACADVAIDRARALASRSSAASTNDWREIVRRDDVDVVIVSTINSFLAEVSVAALDAGKHVLVEKPAARNVRELDAVIAAQKRNGKLVHVGFNHRYHPALRKAKKLHDEGALGEMMFVRGRYGHGGRIGYDREWRADPKLAGGGELIDQGVHLIDLARMFLGYFTQVEGFAKTYFWDMPVDDNAFLLLRTLNERTAALHVSCTEWKNLFSFEIYGQSGKLHAEGLGGSYGVERLAWYRMLPEMGPPETTIWEFPRADTSWRLETAEFLEDIRLGREPSATLDDARHTLTVVAEIYKRSGYDFR
jgi:predicted dehydrogenase